MRIPWPKLVFRASLRTRLMALSVAALMPGFCVIGLTEYQMHDSRQEEVRELSIRSAIQSAFEIDRMISEIRSVLVVASQVPVLRQLDGPACSAYLADLGPHLPNLVAISMTDTTGRIRCGSASETMADVSLADRPYFQEALRVSEAVVGEYATGRVSGRPILPIGLAVADTSGRKVGVLVASLDLAWFGEQLKRRGLPPGGSLTVADRRGVILARQPFPEQFVGTKIPDAFMRIVNAPAPGSETLISQDGTRRVLGYVPVSAAPDGIYVSVGLSAAASYEAVDRATRWGALLALCAGAATLAATVLIGNRAFLAPIRKLTLVLEQWRAGDTTARTGFHDRSGEIGVLGATLDRMMDEIAASQEQRDLLANELAHRVKNTLATVQAIATSTLNKPVPANEVLPGYLARLVALARTHEVLTRDRWEGASLRDIAVGVVKPLCEDVDARFRIDGPPVELQPREALGMTMLLHELCTNAMKYGALKGARGQVDITWSTKETPEETTVDLVWRERDGPPVARPAHRGGFGTRLMARAFGSSGSTTLDYHPDGLTCRAEILMLKAPATA